MPRVLNYWPLKTTHIFFYIKIIHASLASIEIGTKTHFIEEKPLQKQNYHLKSSVDDLKKKGIRFQEWTIKNPQNKQNQLKTFAYFNQYSWFLFFKWLVLTNSYIFRMSELKAIGIDKVFRKYQQ